jgi:hypothetical protein
MLNPILFYSLVLKKTRSIITLLIRRIVLMVRVYNDLIADSETSRPIVGWTVVNEHFIDVGKGNMIADVATIVHEILHALFFHPYLFQKYPVNLDDQPFYIQESDVVYLQGTSLVQVAREHFNCPSLQRSKCLYIY